MENMENNRNKEIFGDNEKYLKSNFAVQKLIKNFYRSIEKIISDLGVKKALEIGCGLGFSTQYLAKFLGKENLAASELNEELLKEAQKRNPEIKISQESIYELKRENSSFDLVIVLEVLEHLADPELALKELSRVSSKYCLLSVPQEPVWSILNLLRFKYIVMVFTWR